MRLVFRAGLGHLLLSQSGRIMAPEITLEYQGALDEYRKAADELGLTLTSLPHRALDTTL